MNLHSVIYKNELYIRYIYAHATFFVIFRDVYMYITIIQQCQNLTIYFIRWFVLDNKRYKFWLILVNKCLDVLFARNKWADHIACNHYICTLFIIHMIWQVYVSRNYKVSGNWIFRLWKYQFQNLSARVAEFR